jgi:large exoprotein involved in heme utilization and adhesion
MRCKLKVIQPAATSHVRGPPGFVVRLYGSALAFSLLAFLSFVPVAEANPTGGTVTNGSANIVTSGNTLDINQSSQRAVINWQSFNVAPNETTKFNQPSSSSVTLNRINNSNPSKNTGNADGKRQRGADQPERRFFRLRI